MAVEAKEEQSSCWVLIHLSNATINIGSLRKAVVGYSTRLRNKGYADKKSVVGYPRRLPNKGYADKQGRVCARQFSFSCQTQEMKEGIVRHRFSQYPCLDQRTYLLPILLIRFSSTRNVWNIFSTYTRIIIMYKKWNHFVKQNFRV